MELCWCIQELESGLSKLNVNDGKEASQKEKQIYNITKSLNVLKSHTAPLIKKRQVMRNSFGDYRAKMAEEEKKFKKQVSSVKFVTNKNIIQRAEKSCIFVKKARSNTKKKDTLDPENNEQSNDSKSPSEPFKFNFSIAETSQLL